MKILRSLVVVWLLLVITAGRVFAAESNNKFGIHLAQPHLEDLKSAAELVNSSGGDWGYVTLVIQENDQNLQKWQDIFNYLRELRLIPIIRLATVPVGPSWRRPSKDGINDWVKFLDSLNWVVKNRYLILFNEPNHGNEWGGAVEAENYAQVAFELAKKLKEKNPDFFVMLAGLDASAPSSPPQFEDEEMFLGKILNFKFEILNYIDGWVSHSYPNPAFSGTPWDFGRGTVRTYQWELELLKNLGVTKTLPVFITETGWKRTIQNSEFIIQNYFKIAYENIWLPDERVVAVTPFVLDYQSEPFLDFSWKIPSASDVRSSNTRQFHEQYYTVASLAKIKGEPERIDIGTITFDLPKELVAQSTYQFKIKLKNLGQAIWDKNENYKLEEEPGSFEYLFSDIKNIKPFEEQEVTLFVKTKDTHLDNDRGENETTRFILKKDEKKILESSVWQFKILPLPSLKFTVKLFPGLILQGDDFEIQIFDERENLVFKKSGLKVKGGAGNLGDIQNIILGKKYRLVILKPYFLPRQEFIVFQKGENQIKFKSMLPFDLNKNGRLDWGDLTELFL